MLKINSFNCRDGYDRPDYDRLLKLSYGSFNDRVAIARRLILDEHTHIRAFDNCLEMNDGTQVVIRLAEIARNGDTALSEKLSELKGRNGIPWIDYPEHFGQPELALT